MNPVLYDIRPSRMLQGEVGLFAVRNIPFNSVIMPDAFFQDTFEDWDAYPTLDEETRRKIDAFCLGTPHGFWGPKDFNLLPVCYFMNHSCDPNVGFDQGENFICLRDVCTGEELCWDYGTGESNPHFRMECHCGSQLCRRVITGNDWRLPELQARYKSHFQSNLQDEINQRRK